MELKLIQGKQISVNLTGSFTGSFSGSLFGTASFAISSSNSISSSFATNSTSASFAVSSSRAVSASFATTASIVQSIANNITNNVDNYILTATGGSTINGEANLTFDGGLLNINGQLEQGENVIAGGKFSHAEGRSTTATGDWTHAEGDRTEAIGYASHVEGFRSTTSGDYSHAEGSRTQAIAYGSHAEGDSTKTGTETAFLSKNPIINGEIVLLNQYGDASTYFTPGGYLYIYDVDFANEIGQGVYLIDSITTIDPTSILLTDTSVNTSDLVIVGDLTTLLNNGDFGGDQLIPGPYSHTEGNLTYAIGEHSHAEGSSTNAIGNASHAEGGSTQAIGEYSHAEGVSTQAIGSYSHAEGFGTQAIGEYSHAEGRITKATGESSHAEGRITEATGDYSHAEGYGTIALGTYQHVQGQYNISSTVQSAFIHGNGIDENSRSNLIYAHDSVVEITGSLKVSGSITGSLFGTASFAVSSSRAISSSFALTASYAATSSNILGGVATHIPFFVTDTTLATSSLYQSGSSTVIINQDNATTANPEALYVWQPSPTSFNVISGKGDINNYLQLNIQNTNQGANASSDVVATANNGDETSNYIDMGINSENFSGDIGGPNDAYIYSAGEHLHIGNTNPTKPIQFFAGGLNSDTNRKLELRPDNNHNITGSLNIANSLIVNEGITGSLFGNASTADNATNATSASHAFIADSALAANYATIAGNGGVTSIIAGSGVTLIPSTGLGNVTIVTTGGGGTTIISGSNITSSFVNSNTWVFNHGLGIRTPTITVFDSNYNQIIPQNIELVSTSSATITFPTLESGFAVAMVGGVAGNAYSASYSLYSTYAATASYFEETDPIFVAKSGSFATTGSNRFIGNQTITGSLIVSSSNSVTVVGPMRVTGSLSVSGSTTQIGNNTLVGNTILSGSLLVSGSQTFLGNLGLTGSLSVSGSTLQTGNNTLVGNTVLSGSILVSGSQTFKGNLDLTGSFTITGSTVQIGNNTLTGNTSLTGSIAMTGSILIFGDVLPQISSSYNLGSETQPWKSIYVQSGSINIQSDIPGGANAELINLGGDVSIKSAGFRVVSGSYTPFRVDTTGRTILIVPNIPANDIGAFSIIGNPSGSYQPVINPSGMIHVTSNDAQAARVTVDGFGTNIGAIYVGRHARGTAALPTPTLSGDVLVRFAGLGYATSSYFPVVGAVPTSLEFQATENYSTSSYGSRAAFYTYANGATSRSLSATIDSTGIQTSGSVVASSFTGSLFGTSSWAISSSNAQTASYVLQAVSSSYASTASYAPNYLLNSSTGSFATTGSNTFIGNQIITGSLTLNSGSALNINDGFFVNGHKQFQYASFFHTASQTLTSATTPLPFQFSTIESNSGAFTVALSGSRRSRITTNTTGWWNIQYSAQATNGSGFNNYDSYTWIRVNETNVINSNNIRTIPQDSFDLLASRNTLIYLASGSYFEIMYGAASTQVSFPYTATATSPTRPATPSISLVVTQHA